MLQHKLMVKFNSKEDQTIVECFHIGHDMYWLKHLHEYTMWIIAWGCGRLWEAESTVIYMYSILNPANKIIINQWTLVFSLRKPMIVFEMTFCTYIAQLQYTTRSVYISCQALSVVTVVCMSFNHKLPRALSILRQGLLMRYACSWGPPRNKGLVHNYPLGYLVSGAHELPKAANERVTLVPTKHILVRNSVCVHCTVSCNVLISSRFPNMEVIATTICISVALGSIHKLHAPSRPSAAHALLFVYIICLPASRILTSIFMNSEFIRRTTWLCMLCMYSHFRDIT